MANINNTKVFFSVTARQDGVARRSFRPAGKAGKRMNSYIPESEGDAETLAIQMASFTAGQILQQGNAGHYMITLPESAAIKMFTAQAAAKKGIAFEDAFAFLNNYTTGDIEALTAACQQAYDTAAAIVEAENIDVQFVQRHRLTSWNISTLDPEAELEEGMELNFENGVDAEHGVQAEVNTLTGKFIAQAYTVRVRRGEDIVEETRYSVARKATEAAAAVLAKEAAGEALSKEDHAVRATRAYAMLKIDELARQDIPEMEEFSDEEFDAAAGEEF